MNAVWNSYGQLCGCPEIFKKSCKFFCRELDIRVPQIMKANLPHTVLLQNQRKMLCEISGLHKFTDLVDIDITGVFFAIGTPA